MKLFKNSDNQWILNGGAFPSGSCYMIYNETTQNVEIHLIHGNFLCISNVKNIEKEDGSTYSDVTEFLSECGSFFNTAIALSGQSVDDILALLDVINGKIGGIVACTLVVADWVDSEQSLTIASATSTSFVNIEPPIDRDEYLAFETAEVSITAKADGSLTFTCTTDPIIDISFNIEIK